MIIVRWDHETLLTKYCFFFSFFLPDIDKLFKMLVIEQTKSLFTWFGDFCYTRKTKDNLITKLKKSKYKSPFKHFKKPQYHIPWYLKVLKMKWLTNIKSNKCYNNFCFLMYKQTQQLRCRELRKMDIRLFYITKIYGKV